MISPCFLFYDKITLMETIVIKPTPTQIKKLTDLLKPYQISKSNPYVILAAKYKSVTCLLYSSGKLVLQGSQVETVANELGLQSDKKTTSQDSVSQTPNQNIPLIGSDEVGNGSYFGGLAVVASYVEPSDHPYLKELGVNDSKTLNDHKIRQIAPLLEKKIRHKALLLSPKKYNQLVGPSKAYNAVSVKVALHNQAIFLLLQSGVKPSKIVIDAFTSKQNYQKHLKKEKNQFPNPLSFIEKAEGQFLAVAVSSIIARNLFLENLDHLSKELGYQLPSGAGKASDLVASQLIKAYGMSALDYSAKLHFANTNKAIALSQKS
ncbi:ribonuclease HIII [Streptococcus pseudoporcinus]|nr:ribonuclease HIII [Streptococcus pseudoporcinus]